MADLIRAITESVEALGMIRALFILFIVLIISYIIWNLNKTHKLDKETIAKQSLTINQLNKETMEAIKENRDMSEKQLIAINVLVSKIDSYTEVSQYLLKEKLDKEDIG